MRPDGLAALRARCRGVSTGLYAADPATLGAAVSRLAGWGGQVLHFDVMDGVFVPQLTAGPAFVAAFGQGMVRDVHLMLAEPVRHVASFVKAGADILSVHAESTGAAEALAAIRAAEMAAGRPVLAGLAVMPGTDPETLGPLLALRPDLILVLALDPRDGAPPQVAPAAGRLAALRARCASFDPLFAFDGGVTLASAATAAAAAPDLLVSGSAIWAAADPAATFAALGATWAAGQPREPADV